ncbi:hypothetical protein ACF0H5_005875 [Mactra antiquata]
MGQQVSVETFTSSRDTDGNKYWASFDPYPFKVGSKKLVYMGILNGNGPLKGQKCVVKTVRNGAISQQDWLLEAKRASLARDMGKAYNKVTPKQEKKITFNCPIMAEIDTMSDCLCINDVLGKPKKKWRDSEHVSIELYLRGKFDDFEFGWVPTRDLAIPESFSHFTWCKSEGNFIITNLQGVMDREAYHFTGPIVHSEDKRFGTSDLGHDGIKGFFKLHKCNRVCKHWPRLGDCIDLRGWGEHWGELLKSDGSFPSAPPSPTPFTQSPPPYTENSFMPYSRFVDRNDGHYEELVTSQSRRSSSASIQQQGRQCMNQIQQTNQSQTNMTTHPYRNASIQQGGTQWRRIGDQGMLIDWREEFLNQTNDGGRDNPMFQNEMFGMQLMWVVKQMSYAVYAPPPPPYTSGILPHNGRLPSYLAIEEVSDKKDYYTEIDDIVNSPPPYSEENVDPNLEYVTYL